MRELNLSAKDAIFGVGLIVVADLADRDHPVLVEVPPHHGQDAVGQVRVVCLFRIQRQGGEMANAELKSPETLPAKQREKVVLEGAHVGSRLPDPEGRLDDGGDAGISHGLIVVGGSGGHVDVRVE